MSTKKKSITFYATEKVERWLEAVPAYSRSLIINKILERYVDVDIDAGIVEQLANIERRLYVLEKDCELP